MFPRKFLHKKESHAVLYSNCIPKTFDDDLTKKYYYTYIIAVLGNQLVTLDGPQLHNLCSKSQNETKLKLI